MQESTNREKILKKVRSALIQKTQNPFPHLSFYSPIFPTVDEVPELNFAQRFSEAGGNFIFCENKLEFAESLLHLFSQKKWKNIFCKEKLLSDFLTEIEFPYESNSEINTADVAITSCECLVAQNGSILVSSANNSRGIFPSFSSDHIVYASTNQLKLDLKDAFTFMKAKYSDHLPSSMTFITGQGKAADTENISTAAPKELFLFLVDEPDNQIL